MEPFRLRQWRDNDLDALAEMNSDPEVMRFFPALMTRAESKAFLDRVRSAIDERGWGLWALEVEGQLAGLCGLNPPRFEAAFTPCVEVGWRLRREYWGRSIAYQAALQALDYGYGKLGLAEIVSFTAVQNLRSRRLMERLGFVRDLAGDFDHPMIAPGNPVRRHVLYRKPKTGWATESGEADRITGSSSVSEPKKRDTENGENTGGRGARSF